MNGGIIRRLRKNLGMTQETFAAELGVERVTVARWETRHTKAPSPLALKQIHRLRIRHEQKQASQGQNSGNGSGPTASKSDTDSSEPRSGTQTSRQNTPSGSTIERRGLQDREGRGLSGGGGGVVPGGA